MTQVIFAPVYWIMGTSPSIVGLIMLPVHIGWKLATWWVPTPVKRLLLSSPVEVDGESSDVAGRATITDGAESYMPHLSQSNHFTYPNPHYHPNSSSKEFMESAVPQAMFWRHADGNEVLSRVVQDQTGTNHRHKEPLHNQNDHTAQDTSISQSLRSRQKLEFTKQTSGQQARQGSAASEREEHVISVSGVLD